MDDLDLERFNVGIDLALEAKELAESAGNGPIPGVVSEVSDDDGIKITRLDVTTEEGSRIMGKMIGHYVTFEVPELRKQDTGLQDRVATKLAQEFAAFLERINVPKTANVLIVGLGNWNVTPDALGPIVVENTLVTRHFFELMPNEVAPGYRNVSAVAPGVLGITGIESSDIVQGIVDRSKPDLIIAIDALASKALERVNTTIQIADTGIHPGSGIGNKRRGLTKDILGVPVVAIGVPTVLYASTIVSNSIDLMREHLKKHANQATDGFMGLLDSIDENERLLLVREALGPLGHDLLVTPKEIDQFIEDIANIVASGLNAALHEAVDKSNVAAYTH
ncbi:GPR endopeptidase [Paenibacillus sp. MWE-103]|uniref:Germination protease n=1 Tax=Paenibacillus artemisiicola TaxID=1172618 RepID=A0ABS3WDX1_9BACL|nr:MULTISPECIES: GPR endopeptidase [Paenibacillus]MBO7746493.1 GPR endopeptidase [Paenibacillus artemisiicola]SFI62219.1 spore protease [Paenibacillus sp. UNC496MF]